MLWDDLLKNISVVSSGNSGNPEIEDVICDSRKTAGNSLFVAIPGFKSDGDSFIKQAISKGAVAVVSENQHKECNVPWAQVNNARKSLGILSREVWHVDTSAITMVGITGTNGKTTTAFLFKKLFDMVYGSDRSWMFSTIRYVTENFTAEAGRTTPESSDIFRMIGQSMLKPRSLVMEVSSHSLALDRVSGLTYDCAVWTNCTQDHLDFHKTMEAYYEAKKLLFTRYLKKGGKAVINMDDPWGRRLCSELSGIDIVTYGKSDDASVRILSGTGSNSSTEIELDICGERKIFSSKLSGEFNIYNMTALVAGGYALSVNFDSIGQCLENMEGVPGRMERVPLNAEFSVYVDYAHTPDALENVLFTARRLTERKLWCVFGCGGDRDRQKRPLMASAVARLADEAVVTSDNPRAENPDMIIRDIMRGMPLDFPHTVISDRKEAIKKAVRNAGKGDCIIIAGKGHENYQEINGEKIHFDDRETVREIFGGMVNDAR
jgi:UDP-N-acetylmuramoyl-L-alanyl-D-glutamate--2,6-diaminopimelate ligase